MGERIAVAADTNSGITAEEAKAWGVTLIPMPFFIDGKVYYEGRTLTQADFYRPFGAEYRNFNIAAGTGRGHRNLGRAAQTL